MPKGLPRSMSRAKKALPAAAIPAATEEKVGGVRQVENLAAFAGADVAALRTELNTMRTAMIAAGLMAAS